MGHLLTTYEVSLLLSASIAIVLAVLAWRKRPNPAAVPMALFAVGVAVWFAGDLLASVTRPPAAIRWNKVTYTGIVLLGPAWLVMGIRYAARDDLLTRRTLAGLAVQPLVVEALVWTNGTYHHLVWEQYLPMDAARGVPIAAGVRVVWGPAFWILVAGYGYLLFSAGTAFVAWRLYRSRELFRVQGLTVLGAIAVPWVANALFLAQVTEHQYTQHGFVVAGVVMFWAVFEHDFMEIAPVARERILDSIHDGVVVVDGEDRVVEINPPGRRILGLTGDREVIGRDLAEALSEYPALHDLVADADRFDDVVELETDGGRRFYHLRVSPLSGRGGREAGRLFVLHDLTEQKRRQRELERQNERLDQFASVVSHDLRNPLNVASIYVEELQRRTDRREADTAAEALERMDELIEDALTLAKEGATVEETEPVDLAAAAETAWENVDTAGATLDVEVDRTIRADRGRLLRVFENLYRNAVEHGSTPSESGDGATDGGADLTVRVGGLGDRSGAVVGESTRGFFVEDDGPGIPEDRRDRVFEQGYTTSSDGTGLGLSIVENVVRAHGWEVRVTEGEDGGARFVVEGVRTVDDEESLTSSTV